MNWSKRAVAIVAAAAFVLASAGAWLRPVWHDELYTLALARMPLGELISALLVDSGPPLHYLICHGLFMLVGWDEGSTLGILMVRLPSVVAYALLPLVVWSTRDTSGRSAVTGPLLVVSWLPLLYFGTEARVYALLALVNALLWIRGLDWIERGGRWTVVFAGCAGCLPLLHYTGLASYLALPALAFFTTRKGARALAVALIGGAVPWLAWSPVMLSSPRASMDWLLTTGGPGRPGLSTVEVLAPAGPYPALFEASRAVVPHWLSVVVLVVLVGVAVVGGIRSSRGETEEDGNSEAAVRLAIGLLPAGALGVAALTGLPLYFAGRTEAMVWGLVAAMIAILVCGASLAFRRLAVGAYAVIGIATIGLWMADLPKRSSPPGVVIGRELATRVADQDRIVVAGLWQLEVRHGIAEAFLEGGTSTRSIPEVGTIPRSQATHPGWLDHRALTAGTLIEEARELSENAGSEMRRIWLVWSPGLPLEGNFFPAFEGWQRDRVARSPVISVDLLIPQTLVRPTKPETN